MVYAQSYSSGKGATTILHDAQMMKRFIVDGILQGEPNLILCTGSDISRVLPRQQSRQMLPGGLARILVSVGRTDQRVHILFLTIEFRV